MDTTLIIDLVLAAVLLIGAVAGAKRGLFKSLMGFVIVIAAFIGAVLLANTLTPPATELVYPLVEDSVVAKLTPKGAMTSAGWADALLSPLEALGINTQGIRDLLAGAQGTATDVYRTAVSEAARSMVASIVHALLLLALYIALLFVLKLIVRALDRVLDLPVLSTLNGIGGAVLGLAEAAILLYIAIYIATHLGATVLTDHAEDTYLLPFFLNDTPMSLLQIGDFAAVS